jgi:hypothetical protein
MNNTNFEQIVHDIRNMRQLTNDQKKSISSLTDEEKNQIIYLYDEMIKYSLDIINQIYLKEENYHK